MLSSTMVLVLVPISPNIQSIPSHKDHQVQIKASKSLTRKATHLRPMRYEPVMAFESRAKKQKELQTLDIHLSQAREDGRMNSIVFDLWAHHPIGGAPSQSIISSLGPLVAIGPTASIDGSEIAQAASGHWQEDPASEMTPLQYEVTARLAADSCSSISSHIK